MRAVRKECYNCILTAINKNKNGRLNVEIFCKHPVRVKCMKKNI